MVEFHLHHILVVFDGSLSFESEGIIADVLGGCRTALACECNRTIIVIGALSHACGSIVIAVMARCALAGFILAGETQFRANYAMHVRI